MVVFSQCLDCKNYFFNIKNKNSCKAFPNGISNDIFFNKIIHNKKIKNDHGFRFKPLWDNNN